jgi:hypothetical protein
MGRKGSRWKAAGLAGGLLVLGLASCGGDDDSATGPATEATSEGSIGGDDETGTDNCALVTAEEASALIGEPVQAPEDSPLGCGWTPEDETLAYLIVSTLEDDDRSPSEIMADDWEGTDGEVEGVADGAAYNVSSDGTVTAFATRNGDRTVLLVTTFIGIEEGTPAFDTLVATARAAADRL